MEKINKYSLTDDQGNLVRVSSHGPSIDDIEITSVTKKQKNKQTKIVKFVFCETDQGNIDKVKDGKNLYFFGELKSINFVFSERRYTRNINVEIKMETTAALNVINKFKKTYYMCSKMVLPGDKRNLNKNKKNKLKRIIQFSIIRIFGDKATVKVVVAQ